MTTKEAFRLGFLSRLAERGVTPSQFEKQAADGIVGGLSDLAGRGLTAAGNVAGSLTPLALAALVGIPAAGGVLTGWGHSGLTDVSEEDIKREKMRDFIETYRSEAQRIRRKLNRDAWRQPKAKRRRYAAAEF